MDAETLARRASILYGPCWQTALAAALHRPGARSPGITPRLVRYWAAGARPIPSWVGPELVRLARERRKQLAEIRG